MKKTDSRLFLYCGLCLLLISLMLRAYEISNIIWIPIFGLAIALKTIFLIKIFQSKEFTPSLWIVLILIGVAMILISLLFKYVFPFPLLHSILFYGAITLKVTGLILMLGRKLIDSGKRDK